MTMKKTTTMTRTRAVLGLATVLIVMAAAPGGHAATIPPGPPEAPDPGDAEEPGGCPTALVTELLSFVDGAASRLQAQGHAGYAVSAARRAADGTLCRQTAAGGFARSAPDGPAPMRASTVSSSGSVSKVLLAAFVVQMLDARGKRETTAIGPFLPPTWELGPGVARITFEELLEHRSGLPTWNDVTTSKMKQWLAGGIAKCVDASGKPYPAGDPRELSCRKVRGPDTYNNMGYGLLQVLASSMQSPLMESNLSLDHWDHVWLSGWVFEEYAKANYFKSIDGHVLASASCTFDVSSTNYALDYRVDATTSSYGRHLSPDGHEGCGVGRLNLDVVDLTAVIDRIEHAKIVSPSVRDRMRANLWGWEGWHSTFVGDEYLTNGGASPLGDDHGYKAMASVFPSRTAVVVLVNSPMLMGTAIHAAWDARTR
jgi:hypothetical protein